MTPDPSWQPKVGDVVAVRRTLASRGHPKYDRAAWWMTNGDGAAAHDLAPWLSAEDHAALLRRIEALEKREAALLDLYHDVLSNDGDCYCGARLFYGQEHREGCKMPAADAALAATEHIR